MEKILTWSRKRGLVEWYGKGTKYGSCFPVVEHNGICYQIFSIWTSGSIGTGFQYLYNKPPFDQMKLLELLTRINSIPGIAFPETAVTKRPEFSISVLEPEANLQQFLSVFDWVIEQIKSS